MMSGQSLKPGDVHMYTICYHFLDLEVPPCSVHPPLHPLLVAGFPSMWSSEWRRRYALSPLRTCRWEPSRKKEVLWGGSPHVSEGSPEQRGTSSSNKGRQSGTHMHISNRRPAGGGDRSCGSRRDCCQGLRECKETARPNWQPKTPGKEDNGKITVWSSRKQPGTQQHIKL